MTHTAYPSLSLKGRGTGAQRQGEGVQGRGKTPNHLLERSRELRQGQTEAEARLWTKLRGSRLQGFKFRRQVPMGDYIVDFACPSAKLIVELDGSQHVDAAAYDDRRTRFLSAQGYRVLRYWNNDALSRTDDVLEDILRALTTPHPGGSAACPSPLQGEGLEQHARHPSPSRGEGQAAQRPGWGER